MNMKKAIVVLLSLVIVLVLVPTASTNPDNSTYDPMADVNRDGVIDIYDLARLGKAYGTTQTVPTIPNQTVVYVYQIEKDPAEVENARVAIIDPDYCYQAVQVNYTNSSGLVNFTLNPNSNYMAIAWSNATYNNANFTTNEYGEASVIIQLGYPHLPANWATITIVNRTTRELWSVPSLGAVVGQLVYNITEDAAKPSWGPSIAFNNFKGVFVVGPWHPTLPMTDPGKSYIVVFGAQVWPEATTVYTPDENGTANVITYV